MTPNIGCVDCVLKPNMHWQPKTFYIYNGTSFCVAHLEDRIKGELKATES